MKTKRKVPPRDFVSVSAQGLDQSDIQSFGLYTVVNSNNNLCPSDSFLDGVNSSGTSDHACSSISNKRHKTGQPVVSNVCSVAHEYGSPLSNLAGVHVCESGDRTPLAHPITSPNGGCSVIVSENVAPQSFGEPIPGRKGFIDNVRSTAVGSPENVDRRHDRLRSFIPSTSHTDVPSGVTGECAVNDGRYSVSSRSSDMCVDGKLCYLGARQSFCSRTVSARQSFCAAIVAAPCTTIGWCSTGS